ncbi:MAG: citrulline utilization hydrolase CtlX [Flavisolibacter sp.]
MQITDTVLMIRPAAFGFNAETAANNFFQQDPGTPKQSLQARALEQFDRMVNVLRENGINVIVEEDLKEPTCPDAVFPNNWFTASNSRLSIFPMFAQSRRAEKRDDILEKLSQLYKVEDVQDWSEFEAEAMYLEGTGSMVMDHEHRIIYACLSPRTHPAVVEKFASANGYRALTFTAHDEEGRQIYHTNVMMCIGENFAVLCPKAITDHIERIAVAQLLETTGHENIYITQEQLKAFAGNMLQLKNVNGEKMIVMSQAAYEVLEAEQKEKLTAYGKLLPIDVSIIEQVEGGSVRCMMAEIFLEPR